MTRFNLFLRSNRTALFISILLTIVFVASPFVLIHVYEQTQFTVVFPWVYFLGIGWLTLSVLYLFYKQRQPSIVQVQPIKPQSITLTNNTKNKTDPSINYQTLELLQNIQAIIIEHGYAVSTDENTSLYQMAQNFTHEQPSDAEAIGFLLTKNQAQIWTEVDDLYSCHAQILLTLITATNLDLGISNIKSHKDAKDHHCLVTFQFNNRQKRWQFEEPGNHVAENFLNHAISAIGQIAGGRFILSKKQETMLCYTFIPLTLFSTLSSIFEISLQGAESQL